MAYPKPPLQAEQAAAIAVAVTNTTVIAAPGAGKCIRLVAAILSINNLSTGVTNLTLTSGVGGASLVRAIGLQLTGQANLAFNFPEPGYQLPANTALVMSEAGTVAAGTWTAVVYYFVDNVV